MPGSPVTTGICSSWRTPKAFSRALRAEGRRRGCLVATAGLRLGSSSGSTDSEVDRTLMTSALLCIVVEQLTWPPMKKSVLPLAL